MDIWGTALILSGMLNMYAAFTLYHQGRRIRSLEKTNAVYRMESARYHETFEAMLHTQDRLG